MAGEAKTSAEAIAVETIDKKRRIADYKTSFAGHHARADDIRAKRKETAAEAALTATRDARFPMEASKTGDYTAAFKDPLAAGRSGEAQQVVKIGNAILEFGYPPQNPPGTELLTAGEKTFIEAQVRRQLEGIPAVKAVLDAARSPATVNRIVCEVLNDPKVAVNLRNLQGSKMTEMVNLSAADLEAKQQAADAADKELRGKDNALTDKKDRRDELSLRLKAPITALDRKYGTAFLSGKKVDYEGAKHRVDTDLRKHSNEFQLLSQIKADAAKRRAWETAHGYSIDVDLNGLDAQINDEKQWAAELEERIDLDQVIKDLQRERADAAYEKTKADTTLGHAKGRRDLQEQNALAAVRQCYGEAALQYVETQLTETRTAEEQVLAKRNADAKEKAEKNFFSSFQSRWDIPKLGKDGRAKKIDVKKVEVVADFKVMLDPTKGPDGVIEDMLIKHCGMSTADAKEKLKDSDFMEKARVQVQTGVVSRMFRVGGVTRGEAQQLFDTEWGQATLTKAIEKNDNAKKFLNELGVKDLLKLGGFENFNKKYGRLAYPILAAVLAGVFSPLLGAVMLKGALVAGPEYGGILKDIVTGKAA